MAFCQRPENVHEANELNEIYWRCRQNRFSIENQYLHIEYKTTQLFVKRFSDCPIHAYVVQECYSIASSVVKI